MSGRPITAVDQLSGPERAAVVMLAIGEEGSKPIWASLDEDDIREVTRAMTKLGSVAPDVVDGLLQDFMTSLSTTSAISGSATSAQRFLQNVMPADRASAILEDLKGPAGKTMWEKLANVNERMLSSYLRNEHPQTVAVILSRIRADHAAKVLAALPGLFAEEVIARMLTLGPVQKEIIDQIEQALKTEFMAALSRGEDRDPYAAVADIFNKFDRAAERRFMDALSMKNPDAAARVRGLMFVFEDLTRLDPADMQTLLRFVDKPDLALALKGATPDVAHRFYANMSERAATFLRDDIEIMGGVRQKDIDAAQTRIVETAKRLADEGEIVLGKDDDEELVY
ncbi:MAG: flagellar motor switch protein FliG [Parvularculaceae bacterium]|nr:flagellar motor switch protein FliG [Parvularculaceae bacterium]